MRIVLLTILVATLAGCARDRPYQQIAFVPHYATPPVCPGGIYGGYMAGMGQCSAQVQPQPAATHCMPYGPGNVMCRSY